MFEKEKNKDDEKNIELNIGMSINCLELITLSESKVFSAARYKIKSYSRPQLHLISPPSEFG